MRVGKVIGSIWATRKAECLQGQTFLVVKSEDEVIVAADQVVAGEGDRVLLATGTVTSRYCMDAPVDAAIVAIVDEK
jgi:ethanolamine utilization protein EutN